MAIERVLTPSQVENAESSFAGIAVEIEGDQKVKSVGFLEGDRFIREDLTVGELLEAFMKSFVERGEIRFADVALKRVEFGSGHVETCARIVLRVVDDAVRGGKIGLMPVEWAPKREIEHGVVVDFLTSD